MGRQFTFIGVTTTQSSIMPIFVGQGELSKPKGRVKYHRIR